MTNIKLRPQKISDAKRFYEILNNNNFIYFPARPKSVAAEKKWIEEALKHRKEKTDYNYAIIFNGIVVGGIGIKVNFRRKYIAEIGYCIDEKYWGKGIATQAVKLAEDICFKKLKIMRIEIIMQPANMASEKVAVKNGYKKEGRMRKALKGKDGKAKDGYLYSKIL